jgi:hypothetical protein
VISAIGFILRLLRLSRSIDHLLTTGRTRTERVTARLGLEDPIVFAQAVATVGTVSLVLVIWWFYPVLWASSVRFSTEDVPLEQLSLLSPGYTGRAAMFRFVLDVLGLGFAMAAFRIARLRKGHDSRKGMAAMGVVVALLVTAILVTEVPYRVMWQNQAERIYVAEERCYVIGQSGDEQLIYCPDRPPPRNRVIRADDQSVRRPGIVESRFAPLKDTLR